MAWRTKTLARREWTHAARCCVAARSTTAPLVLSPILLSADGDRMEKGVANDEMRSQTHPVVRGASACRPRSAVRRARLVSRPAAEWFEGGKGEEHGEEHRQLSPFCRVHACACVGVWPWLLTAMTVHASFGASDRTLFVSIGSDDW